MSSVSYLGRQRSGVEARAFFLAARNAEALAALGGNASVECSLLRARCLLRLGDAESAAGSLRGIEAFDSPAHLAVEHQLLLATSLARCGQLSDANKHYAAAERIALPMGSAIQLELALFRAVDAWTSRNLDLASRIATAGRLLARTRADPYSRDFAVLRAQLLELSSLIAASREEYTTQAELLIAAWNSLAETPGPDCDAWVQASILRNLAPLVWDLHLVDGADFLRRALSKVSWTNEIAPARYVAHRALAWNSALEGDHIGAFARFREGADLAPTVPWRIASTLDRAFLAAEMRQGIILHEEMLRAGEFARSVPWDTVAGEEAEVLLELAEANARNDAILARQWLSRYDRARAFPRHLLLLATDDRRQIAMEQDAHAAVLAAEERIGEAVAMRRAALSTWDVLHHGWRAAKTAMALARLTGTSHDIAAAVARANAFHRSWLGRRARGMERSKRGS